MFHVVFGNTFPHFIIWTHIISNQDQNSAYYIVHTLPALNMRDFPVYDLFHQKLPGAFLYMPDE